MFINQGAHIYSVISRFQNDESHDKTCELANWTV